MHFVKNIKANDFKDYLKAMKACKPGPAFELEGKYGFLHLNFSSFLTDLAKISFRRKSGNGIVLLISGDNVKEFQITSKVRSEASIKLDASGDLYIKRTQRSNGMLDVLSIDLFSEVDGVVDWSGILKKCKTYSCLRMVHGKLMAAEGATIIAEKINSLQTEPPNMFSNNGKEVRFLGSCQVLSLDISSEVNPLVPIKPIEQLVHIEPEPQVIINKEQNTPQVSDPFQSVKLTPKPNKQEQAPTSHLLFDSAVSGFTNAFANKDVKIFQKYITLGHRGEYKIPMRNVKSNYNYIIIVEALNVKGNGRFIMHLEPSDGKKTEMHIAPAGKQTFQKKLMATDYADIYHLIIGRHPASTGDIIISRITLIADVVKPTTIVNKIVQTSSNLIGEIPDIQDPVLLKSYRYAIHRTNWESSKKLDFNIDLFSNSYSGLRWFSYIKPMLPNVNINKNNPLLTIQTANLINELGSVLFLEECSVDLINDTLLSKLKFFKKIITPSFDIKNILDSKFENPNVCFGFKPWPLAPAREEVPISGDYILVFNRNPQISKSLINVHRDDMPKIVLMGARGRYPSNVFPVNDYLPYPGVISLIQRAKAIVDVPNPCNYNSGLLRLCSAFGNPILTSNKAFSESGEQIVYITPDSDNILSEESIRIGLETVLNKSKLPEELSAYDSDFNETVKLMLI